MFISFILNCALSFAQDEHLTVRFDNQYNIEINVGNSPTVLAFDTGSAVCVLNESIIDKLNIKQLTPVSKKDFNTGFGKISKVNVYNGVNFELLNSGRFYPEFIINNMDINKFLDCQKIENQGILGLKAMSFLNKNELLAIDNDSNELKVLKRDDRTLSDYHQLNSVFENESIYIDIAVAGKNKRLLFDTGYNGFLLLKRKYRKLKKYDEVEFYNEFSAGLFDTSRSEVTTFENVELVLNETIVSRAIVSVSPDIGLPLFGIEMIKQFNWIIDFEYKKVYCQKRDKDFTTALIKKLKHKNVALAIMGKLYIISTFQDGYEQGKIIESINNEKITSENICQFQDLLKEYASDWTNLSIETN